MVNHRNNESERDDLKKKVQSGGYQVEVEKPGRQTTFYFIKILASSIFIHFSTVHDIII